MPASYILKTDTDGDKATPGDYKTKQPWSLCGIFFVSLCCLFLLVPFHLLWYFVFSKASLCRQWLCLWSCLVFVSLWSCLFGCFECFSSCFEFLCGWFECHHLIDFEKKKKGTISEIPYWTVLSSTWSAIKESIYDTKKNLPTYSSAKVYVCVC